LWAPTAVVPLLQKEIKNRATTVVEAHNRHGSPCESKKISKLALAPLVGDTNVVVFSNRLCIVVLNFKNATTFLFNVVPF